MNATQQVSDTSRVGKKGTPMHWQAFGIDLPTKTVPVEEGEAITTAPPLTIDEVRNLSVIFIDGEAEKQRLAYITPGVGQSMTYARKLEEAKAYISDPSGDFPMMSASIGVDGDDLDQIAQVILNLDYQWTVIGGYIETVRLSAKHYVNTANTIEEIQSIIDSLNWNVGP